MVAGHLLSGTDLKVKNNQVILMHIISYTVCHGLRKAAASFDQNSKVAAHVHQSNHHMDF